MILRFSAKAVGEVIWGKFRGDTAGERETLFAVGIKSLHLSEPLRRLTGEYVQGSITLEAAWGPHFFQDRRVSQFFLDYNFMMPKKLPCHLRQMWVGRILSDMVERTKGNDVLEMKVPPCETCRETPLISAAVRTILGVV